MNITTEQVRITPAVASEFLRANSKNRAASKNVVSAYAQAIKRGEWMMNGEAIIFDSEGRLVNGQHRCLAVISADTPIDALVVRGVPPESFATYDRAKRRTPGDVLSIAGEANSNTLAAACKAYHRVKTKSYIKDFTSAMALKVLEETPSLRFWTTQYANRRTVRNLFTSSLVGVLCAAAERYGDQPLLSFMDKLESGAGLQSGEPALVLRERFLDRAARTSFTAEYALAMYIKCVNAYISGKPIGVLRIRANEKFPELI